MPILCHSQVICSISFRNVQSNKKKKRPAAHPLVTSQRAEISLLQPHSRAVSILLGATLQLLPDLVCFEKECEISINLSVFEVSFVQIISCVGPLHWGQGEKNQELKMG